jgi:hypothetical protein
MSRNRFINSLLFLGVAFMTTACEESPTQPDDEPEVVAWTTALSVSETGNGAPSGAHYNLNIIGVPRDKSADMSQGGGHVIFVGLGDANNKRKTKILLSAGDEFLVTDKNGTDGRAGFQLPTDVSTTFSVYARALGKPGGESSLQLCAASDPGLDGVFGTDDDVLECGGTEVFTKGKKFTDVSETLLFLSIAVDPESELGGCLELEDDPEVDDPLVDVTLPLFDGCLDGYLWDYTNAGLKLLQLRFYPKPAA